MLLYKCKKNGHSKLCGSFFLKPEAFEKGNNPLQHFKVEKYVKNNGEKKNQHDIESERICLQSHESFYRSHEVCTELEADLSATGSR